MLALALKKPATATIVALVAVSLVACGGGSRRTHRGGPGGGSPPAVPVSTAAPATVKPSIQIAGIIAPYQNVSISSSLTEPADSVAVLQGDHVSKGQVLARLDTADLQAQLDADLATAQSAVANTEHSVFAGNQSITQGDQGVRGAQANLTRDQAILTRDGVLFKEGYISLQAYQADQATVGNDESALRSAQATAQANGTSLNAPGLQSSSVAQSRAQEQVANAQAEQIRVQIGKAAILSPVDGVVVNRNLNTGEYPGARTIFTVQQLDPVYAELNASSSQVFTIQRHAPVSLAIAGITGEAYEAKVNAVLGQVSPGSTNFTVEAIAANPGLRLQSGMAVTGTIQLAPVSGIGIPTAAFLDDSHTTIMVVTDDGTAKQQTVKERGSDGTTSIVVGISAGTQVIANGQLGITTGEAINNNANASPSPGASGQASPNPAASGHKWSGHKKPNL
jgi:HlyD family secretion protein